VVTGTVASGQVSVGEELEWHPEGRSVRFVAFNSTIGRGFAGPRCPSGDQLGRRPPLGSTPRTRNRVARLLESSQVLSVEVTPTDDSSAPLRHRGRYRLHLGTTEQTATLAWLEQGSSPTSGPALAQLFPRRARRRGLRRAVHSSGGRVPPRLSAGAGILQPTARRCRRKDLATIGRIEVMRTTDPDQRLLGTLTARRLGPWETLDLVRDTGLPATEIEERIAAFPKSGALVELAIGSRRTMMVTPERIAELEGRLLRALDRLHAAHPRTRLSAARICEPT